MNIRLITAVAVAVLASSAFASPVITNGNFSANGGSGELGYNTTASGWTNAAGAYNFLYTSGISAVAGANGQFGNVAMYGPASNYTSPDGGAFVAMDSDFGQGSLSQSVTGLVAGQKTTVTFYFAGGQQAGFTGTSTDYFAVSLGGQTINTDTINVASTGFTGWEKETLTFTPTTSGAETLSFLAVGTPSSVPSFAFLDGVSVSATPEPSSLALLSTGLLSVGGLLRSRFKKNEAKG